MVGKTALHTFGYPDEKAAVDATIVRLPTNVQVFFEKQAFLILIPLTHKSPYRNSPGEAGITLRFRPFLKT